MSIPRLAIERPVTMFMMSAVVMLLGGISLFRLPVDLMPDVTYPSITVRVGYGGVGPLEIEELVVRPLEQSLARSPASSRSTRQRRKARRASAELRVGHRPERGGRRSAHARRPRARPPAGGSGRADHLQVRLDARRRSWASASRATSTASRCAKSPRTTCRRASSASRASRRSRSTAACAGRFTSSCRRRRSRALDLSVDRVVNPIRSENQNIPLGEVDEGDTTYLLRSQGQFQNLEQIRDLVVLTKGGVPVYLRDIADVKDTTEDLRSFTRINGKPGVRLQITKQSGKNTVAIADAVRAEIERINREVPSVR